MTLRQSPQRKPSRLLAAALTILVFAMLQATAAPPGPGCPSGAYPAGAPNDPDYNSEWWLFGCIPNNSSNARDPEGAAGMSVDWVWAEYTTGRPDVVYAYMEGGPNWTVAQARDIANRTYINRGELPVPGTSVKNAPPADYDVNHDDIFNVLDYRTDARARDANTNGFLDAQDLILAFSDAIDDDNNGYVDDISGWDFFRDDNDPATDQSYTHAMEHTPFAVGEANNNLQGAGICPSCMIMYVRVAPSVLIDTDKFARGIAFAADSGVSVLSISAGAMIASRSTQEAIDYAWEKGTVVVAGSHDLASNHHLSPNTYYEHFLIGQAIVPDGAVAQARTNFREWASVGSFGLGNVLVALSGQGSYSRNSPQFGAVVGLIDSHARNLVDRGVLDRRLTPNEIRQILIASASPVKSEDHTRPDSFKVNAASASGWSQYYGYGRPNLRKAMQLMSDGKIPPEADITSPKLTAFIDPTLTPAVSIEGYADARRADTYEYVVDAAPGLEPAEADFQPITMSGVHSSPTQGVLGTWNVGAIPREKWEKPAQPPTKTWTGVQDFTWTLRLRVTDSAGNTAETRKAVALHHDAGALDGFPRALTAGGTGARLVDLNEDGQKEIVLATNDGRVHAYQLDGSELAGFPVATDPVDVLTAGGNPNYLGAPAYASGALTPYPDAIAGTPAVGDLDRDGDLEIVAATIGDGRVYVWDAAGQRVPGFPVRTDPSKSMWTKSPLRPQGLPNQEGPMLTRGYLASPALADIDGGGDLEIIAPAMDGWVYVWRHTGSFAQGFPVPAKDPTGLAPATSRIVSSPAVGDITGDGKPEIVFGTQRNELHAFQADGTEAPGWPVRVNGIIGIFDIAMAGAPAGPALADVDPSPGLEVAFAPWWGPSVLYDGTGAVLKVFQTAPGPLTDTLPGGAAFLNMTASGAFGDLTGDGIPEYAQLGTQTPWSLEKVAYPFDLRQLDHGLRVWDSISGASLPAFPRRVEDYGFVYMTPVIADLDGDGAREAIQGTGGWLVRAFEADGSEPTGWPKFTNGWTLSPAAVGDLDGDGVVEVVQPTLEGYLFVWRSQGSVEDNDQWWTAGHDDHGTRAWGTNPAP